MSKFARIGRPDCEPIGIVPISCPQFLMNRRQTFLNLSKWLADCRALASPHLVVVLVGNKLDKDSQREVPYLEGLRWAEENSKKSFFFDSPPAYA